MTLGPAYCAAILNIPVNRIDTADVLSVLKPIWTTKAETASRLRGRIERVLAFAEARGWRPEGKNPAQWKNGLDAILPPRQRLQRGHHKALAYHDVPAFMQRLTALPGVSAMALRFIILTAARSGEAVGARWSEIDLTKRIWTVPASRMKAKREHRVPLSDAVVDILNMMMAVKVGDFVFPGQLANRPISAGSVEMLLRRMKAKKLRPFTASARPSGIGRAMPRISPGTSRNRRSRTVLATALSKPTAAQTPLRSAGS